MSTTLLITGVPLLVALNYALTSFVNRALAQFEFNLKGPLLQIVSWAIAIGVVFLVRASDVADTVQVTETLKLSQISSVTALIAGVLIAAGSNAVYDARNALDNHATALEKPPELPPVV